MYQHSHIQLLESDLKLGKLFCKQINTRRLTNKT